MEQLVGRISWNLSRYVDLCTEDASRWWKTPTLQEVDIAYEPVCRYITE